jgi:lipopolysaccharide transport system ATP-binding protein
MNAPAISACGIAKSYTIARSIRRHTTLGEALVHTLRHGFRRMEKETFWALEDVSFDIARGEVVGIIGRNGAGKSTLLKILSQITAPTRGEIDLRGRTGSLLEVGTGFHPELTGRENIFLNGAILGMSRRSIAQQFDSIVAFAETEAFLDTPVKRYSSGMYVRLAFAVAAHLAPDILIVDEVLAVGDLAFQKKCLGKMSDVSSHNGTTVLFVSHNIAAVRKLCTRAILLNKGRIEADAGTESVIAKYLDLNSAELSATIDLPRSEQGAAASATALRTLRASDRQPTAQFRLGEKWNIRIEFDLTRALPHTIVAVGLRNVESVALVTWWSEPRDLAAGKYFAEFVCDLPLCACDLNFAVGISSHEKVVYYAEGVGAVSISEVAEGEQPFRTTGTGVLASSSRPKIQSLH